MKSVLHLSDVHFGRIDPDTLDPLIQAAYEIAPNLVVVSGDLTQRARSHQFQEAREFLDKLPRPQIVVPGNHDVPLWNAFNRFVRPLTKYKRFITEDMFPFYADDEIAAMGVNTARSFTTKYGKINKAQIEKLKEKLDPLPDDLIKIVVTHHPFDLPKNYRNVRQMVGRANLALPILAESGADVFLAGHLHMGYTGSTTTRYKIEGYAGLIVQAGTATSTRGRGEPNSFNVLRCDAQKGSIAIERYHWIPEKKGFVLSVTEEFRHGPTGWSRLEDQAI
jgi:3',5'-cyclic AMP phosphodiesterase CpdA